MTFVFDLDDTILFSTYNDNKVYDLKGHNKKVVESINKLYDDNTIIIHTARHWNDLQFTIKQLKEIGCKYHTLVMGKPTGDYFIDDKALRPEEFLAIY